MIKVAPISDDFVVLLANQIRYAVRIIIRLNKDNRIFEGLVSYLYKKGDKNNVEPQLLVWREIDSVLNVDLDIFSKYYSPIPSPFLENVIQKAFSKQESISKYKKLLRI